MYDAHAQVPVSKVRDLLRRVAVEGKLLTNQNGQWRFNATTPIQGINAQTTYTSEDQAIDAIIGTSFPELRKVA